MSNIAWIPLEANPEVLTTWSERAGLVTASAAFHDVYGFDPELLDMIPKPVKALLFLFPITPSLEEQRRTEDEWIKTLDGQKHVDPTVFFIKQTISNACGTIGLLHALANSNATITPESPLAQFIEKAISLTPNERAELLEKTELFASIHESTAHMGQSEVPTDLDTNLHFIAYIQAPDPEGGSPRLLELDGRRPFALDRGPSTNLLQDACDCIKDHYILGNESMNFNLIALGGPFSEG